MAASRLGRAVILACFALAGCRRRPGAAEGTAQASPLASAPVPATATDTELEACRARIAKVEAEPALPGAPELERTRVEVLGRARGEPLVLVREPRETPDAELTPAALATRHAFAKASGTRRVKGMLDRHKGDRPTLRALLLREGYVYASDPHDALALATLLDLPTLFDEPVIYLEHGHGVRELRRTTGRYPVYRDEAGHTADLLWGDRVATTRDGLANPVHRDLRALARELGFDRTRITRRTEHALLAELRFGDTWLKTLLESDGAKLALGCVDAPRAEREKLDQWRTANARRLAAMKALHAAIDAQVFEAIPFDRPRGEKTAEKDGQLRPDWRWAYLHGQSYFSHEDESYPVFDAAGRPLPPQMCVDFVLDSFERAAGTWFTQRGPETKRVIGSLDFNAFGITNRRAVLAFEKFAEEHPDLFEHERFQPEERIQFGERSRFFAFLLEHADRFRPGDIVAIQGRKADGNIHQHAILIEDTDPVTGFPEALADQMKRPRRRTWEGIMAEAPLRSLLFHVRPTDKVLLALAPQT